MSGILETVKVHEIAGVFGSREDLDGAVDDLLLTGFDRADIDLMASRDAVREKLGKIYIATEELPDIRSVPRRAYVARHDASGALVLVAGVLTTVGVTAAALSIVASGGALALALAASAIGGAGALIARHLGRERAKELETQMTAGGLVLWVRTRSAEREAKGPADSPRPWRPSGQGSRDRDRETSGRRSLRLSFAGRRTARSIIDREMDPARGGESALLAFTPILIPDEPIDGAKRQDCGGQRQ